MGGGSAKNSVLPLSRMRPGTRGREKGGQGKHKHHHNSQGISRLNRVSHEICCLLIQSPIPWDFFPLGWPSYSMDRRFQMSVGTPFASSQAHRHFGNRVRRLGNIPGMSGCAGPAPRQSGCPSPGSVLVSASDREIGNDRGTYPREGPLYILLSALLSGVKVPRNPGLSDGHLHFHAGQES